MKSLSLPHCLKQALAAPLLPFIDSQIIAFQKAEHSDLVWVGLKAWRAKRSCQCLSRTPYSASKALATPLLPFIDSQMVAFQKAQSTAIKHGWG